MSDRVGRAGACRVDKKGRQPHINTMLTEAQEAPTSAGAAALAWAGRVGVIRLMLTDFRNYREARLALGAEPVVVTGPNGAGKTNLLEAISLLAPGRGLRGVRLTEIARRTEIAGTEMDRRSAAACANAAEAAPGRWAVAATIAVRRGALRLGTGRDPADGDRRLVRIDGEPARSQGALGEEIAVLWLTPAMDRLFADGPGGRRRFLDRLVLALDPAHATRVSAYEQALRERARLLRAGFSANRPADPAWLAALEEVMAAQGVAVAAARRETVQRLDHACAESRGPFPRARLALAGTVEDWLDHMPALAAETKLAEALAAARRADALAGGAAIGPHRCD
ncbi:MAG: AAA family ATPase, partial [Stellaceae bacterium]